MPDWPPADFLVFSARCGADPLRIQGPGGNTSIKDGEVMWIKASGTELTDARTKPIFVAVDRLAVLAEVRGAGDGTCRTAVVNRDTRLRPSIETTFHAALDWPVVAHTHSVATLVHVTSETGAVAAAEKLKDLPFITVPYRKPGLPLTRALLNRVTADTQVILLQNHGLIIAGQTVREVSDLMDEVEGRLHMPVLQTQNIVPKDTAPYGYSWHAGARGLALDDRLCHLALAGSYYPDHVVFLGPALPSAPSPASPACLLPGQGAALRDEATAVQSAMLQCLADVLVRLPDGWWPSAIGAPAERELLNWDAEKYRQGQTGRKD